MIPSLVFPSSEGGGGWGGASFDPQHGVIYVNTRSLGTMAQLRTSRSSNMFDSYAKQKIPFEDAQGYPCSAAPWGELMAIDANTADMLWRVPLGEYKELTARGVPKTGTANAGGIVTPPKQEGIAILTAEEKAIAKLVGVSEEEMLAAKKKEAA